MLATPLLQAANPPERIQPLTTTYLGDNQRNYYGDLLPDRLDILWKTPLGQSQSPAYNDPHRLWKGAGWTGQPLLVLESGQLHLIQPTYGSQLLKIRASDGHILWRAPFDDILKATPALWTNPRPASPDHALVILQGSRSAHPLPPGVTARPSYRALSYATGLPLWSLDTPPGPTDSRDVDASAALLPGGQHIAIPQENGFLAILDPDPARAQPRDGLLQPRLIRRLPLTRPADLATKGYDLAPEASPALLGQRLYIPGGNGVLYGYHLPTARMDWTLDLGGDLNGSPAVTQDNSLLVTMEKQFIPGPGGLFKINPALPPAQSILWFLPVRDAPFFHWTGGIIGSAALNTRTKLPGTPELGAIIGVDGDLVVFDPNRLDPAAIPSGPFPEKTTYPAPAIIFRHHVGGTIATPLFVQNRLALPLDTGVELWEHDQQLRFRRIARLPGPGCDATPATWNGRLYLPSRDGNLYCLGHRPR